MSDKYGPWIGWNGGSCPLGTGTTVSVISKDKFGLIAKLDNLVVKGCSPNSWEWDNHLPDIMTYRVKLDPVVVKYKVYFNPNNGGFYNDHHLKSHTWCKNAVITITDGVPSIEWVD